MATIRQKKLAKAVVENINAAEPLNKQELVASVGYSDASADKKATEILESKGVQTELRKLGFDSDNAKKVVGEILDDVTVEPQHRLNAADKIFKVNGDYAPERHVNLNFDVELEQREREYADRLLNAQRTA